MAAETSSCEVQVLVNGVPIPGLRLIRQSQYGKPDQITLSGHSIVELNAGDLIQVRVVPVTGKYQLQARLNMKLEPWF